MLFEKSAVYIGGYLLTRAAVFGLMQWDAPTLATDAVSGAIWLAMAGVWLGMKRLWHWWHAKYQIVRKPCV